MSSESTLGASAHQQMTPAEWEEHSIISGVHGKKVFVVDAFGNQVSQGAVALRIYNDGTYDYICKAAPGSAAASAVWQIRRIDSSGNTLFADGDANFDNLATSQAVVSALTYS